MDQATAQIAASGLGASGLGVGAAVPDFSLPLATGAMVSLSALLTKGPVVLAFYRGGWCPHCSTELRALQAKLPEIMAAGATLVATAEKLGVALSPFSLTREIT